MTQMRRQDLNLGATAGGGNKGSFAPHQRSVFAAPPPPVPVPDPPAETQWRWNDTPRDLLPEEPPAGLTEDDWALYIRWRKRLRTDRIPEEKQTRRAPYGLRMAWDSRANESLNRLYDMMGNVPANDPSWVRARDEAIRASAKAADPGCTGITITRHYGGDFTAVLHDSVRDPKFRATPAENALNSRISKAIGVAGPGGLPWTVTESGPQATIHMP